LLSAHYAINVSWDRGYPIASSIAACVTVSRTWFNSWNGIRSPPTILNKEVSVDQVDFQFIANQALKHIREFLADWLPGGRVSGCEYVALNPTRVDHHPGSFRINMQTGRWADFATNDRGGDLISLYAYLKNTSQANAAISMTKSLGMEPAFYGRQQRARCR